jgi:hypothetical protein
MFGWLRRRRRSRQHPTPQQAFEALSEARCLYAPISKCSGPPRPVGFADDWDAPNVLCCRAHVGRLRRMDSRTAGKLERHLRKEFERNADLRRELSKREEQDGVRLVMGGSSRRGGRDEP